MSSQKKLQPNPVLRRWLVAPARAAGVHSMGLIETIVIAHVTKENTNDYQDRKQYSIQLA
jgi:hypothetical protein